MPDYNPYVYTFNNPIMFTDPTGMVPEGGEEWRNSTGQLVYDVSANKGKGDYTKNATEQDKSFGDMLKNSGEEGKKQFDALTKSEAKISVEFKDTESLYNQSDNGRFFADDINDDYSLIEGRIELYLPTIQDTYDKIKSGEMSPENYGLESQQLINVNLVKDNGLSVKEYATSVFGHEINHTNKNNIKGQLEGARSKIDIEFVPRRVQGENFTRFL